MKILTVHPHDVLSEPWTIRIVKFCEEFRKKGHSVTLVHFPNPARRQTQPLIRERGPDGVRLVELSKYSVFQNTVRLTGLARNHDLVFFQKAFPHAAIPALAAAFAARKPLHYDWDDNETAISREWTTVGAIHFLFRLFEEFLPSMAETVSVSTTGLREKAIEFGAWAERVTMAPVGADLQQFRPRGPDAGILNGHEIRPPIVAYVGQLEGGSYCDLLLRAARLVLQRKAEVRFLVVGGGFKLTELLDLADRLGIRNSVTFTGYVPQEKIPLYLSVSDVAVAVFEDTEVSRYKSPLKIAEYMAAGKAVVANRVGDVPLMLGDAGVMVDTPDPQGLSSAILSLVDDPDRIAALGEKARRRAVEEYNWERSAENILKLITLKS